jgi:putative NADH-flavin reductase
VRLTVLGATGGVGRSLLDQALAAGHELTAVVRRPEVLPAAVRPVRADLSVARSEQLQPAVAGADAVLSALGPRSRAEAGIVSQAIGTTLEAMHATGTRRLVVVSAVPAPTVATSQHPDPPKWDPGDGPMVRFVLNPIVRTAFGHVYRDLARMEELVAASGLGWTVIRPPRLLDHLRTGSYRTATDRNLRGGTSVPRADVADLMLRVIADPAALWQAIRLAQ